MAKVLLNSKLFLHIEINYTFEAEKERKQLNMHSRVLFKDHQSDTFNASTILNGQNSKQCVTTKLVLQVRHSIRFFF